MHFVKEKIIEARFLLEIYDVTRHQFVFRSITSAMYAWQNSYMYYGMDSFIMYIRFIFCFIFYFASPGGSMS